MLKKIEQYLITNYPIIWNLRLVPIFLLVATASILLFLLGYSATDSSISINEDSFASGGFYYLLYAGAVLTAILIFIFWLVQYNRNNGLKAYYPQSNLSLYLEWLAIFALSFSICFIPNALSLGKTAKWKAAVSEKEYLEAKKVLARAKALQPTQTYNFELNSQTPLMVGNAEVDRTKFDTKLYTYDESATDPSNPIEFVAPSLLYYKDNISYLADDEMAEVDQVHQWLVEQNKDSISASIQALIDLHKKHKLKTNIDASTWMKIIYNPPLYPIDENKTIESYDYNISNHLKEKYTQTGKLDSYYSEVKDNYAPDGFQKWFILVTLTIALGLSAMAFSARITSGKSWIFALLALGVILFVFSLFSGLIALIGGGSFYSLILPIFWLLLFAALTYAITIKIVNGYKKGKSNIYINIAIWFIPALTLWIYQIYTFFTDIQKSMNDDYGSSHTDTPESLFVALIINLIFTVIFMFPVTMLLRKWKALPEE